MALGYQIYTYRKPCFKKIAFSVNPRGRVKEAPPTIAAIPGGFFGRRNPSGLFGQNGLDMENAPRGGNFGDVVLL